MMKYKLALLLPLILIALFSWYYLSQRYDLTYMSASEQKIGDVDYAFNKSLGVISMADGVKKLQFKYKNTTDQTITFNQLYTSCMCTKAQLVINEIESPFAGMKGHRSGLMPINPNMQLAAGETAQIEVEFDPNAHGPEGVGPMTRSVFLEIQEENDELEFIFDGEVIK